MSPINKLVSIIIPVYNSHLYVEQCLRSAKGQSYSKIEIIVIDDGSNNTTKSKLRELHNLIDIHIVQKNLGPSAARNRGIQKANGFYLLMLDSDDYFEPTFLEKAISILEGNQSVKFVSSYLHRFEKNKIGPVIKMRGGTLEDFLFKNATLGNGLFRKNDIDVAGGYDEDMRDGYVDWELMIRVLRNGGSAYVIPEALFMYRSNLRIITNHAKTKRPEILEFIFTKHKDIYINHFESLLKFYKKEQNLLYNARIKVLNSSDYIIGRFVLSPIRKLKRLLKVYSAYISN